MCVCVVGWWWWCVCVLCGWCGEWRCVGGVGVVVYVCVPQSGLRLAGDLRSHRQGQMCVCVCVCCGVGVEVCRGVVVVVYNIDNL